jgi:hypothetical protein
MQSSRISWCNALSSSAKATGRATALRSECRSPTPRSASSRVSSVARVASYWQPRRANRIPHCRSLIRKQQCAGDGIQRHPLVVQNAYLVGARTLCCFPEPTYIANEQLAGRRGDHDSAARPTRAVVSSAPPTRPLLVVRGERPTPQLGDVRLNGRKQECAGGMQRDRHSDEIHGKRAARRSPPLSQRPWRLVAAASAFAPWPSGWARSRSSRRPARVLSPRTTSPPRRRRTSRPSTGKHRYSHAPLGYDEAGKRDRGDCEPGDREPR